MGKPLRVSEEKSVGIWSLSIWELDCLFGLSFTVIGSMKSVLKKTKGSDVLKEIEEPAVKSNPLARGKKNVDISCWQIL